MNMSVNIGSLNLRNPVMNASGTFGLNEYGEYINFNKIGALVTKSVTQEPRLGNKLPRITEFKGGIINSVGIQNDGVVEFIKNKVPNLQNIDTNIIISISNMQLSDFAKSTEMFEKVEGIGAFEINVSCPNLSDGGRAFGMVAEHTYEIAKSVKEVTDKPIFIKLTPNVTDITEIAHAAVEGGADALTVANTYIGMEIDLKKRKPFLGNIIGGVSGHAIKPLTLRHVYEIRKKLNIPIIASGGVYTTSDALEYLLVGATAIQVGTANFLKPDIMEDIVNGIESYMKKERIEDINDFIGTLKI